MSKEPTREEAAREGMTDLTDNDVDIILEAMRDSGRSVGHNMATWADIDERNAQKVIDLLDNCEAGDYFQYPNLSGEWADEPTPQSLLEEISAISGLGYDEIPDWLTDEACEAWEVAASEAFEDELYRRARYYLGTQS